MWSDASASARRPCAAPDDRVYATRSAAAAPSSAAVAVTSSVVVLSVRGAARTAASTCAAGSRLGQTWASATPKARAGSVSRSVTATGTSSPATGKFRKTNL